MCDESMQAGEVKFSLHPMECKRVRVEASYKHQDDTLWAIHMDIGPKITDHDMSFVLSLLLCRLARQVQKD